MTKILLKRGTQSKVDEVTLSVGEPAFATDTKNLYVGDGVDKIKINGTTDHSALTKLDFASSGHTGFAPTDNPSFTTKINLTASSDELLNFQTLSLKYQPIKGTIALNNRTASTDNYSNVFIGVDSGTAMTNDGYNNAAIGRYSMQNSTRAIFSVAIGNGSLRNSNGSNNVGVGAYASETSTTASNTVAIGAESLRALTVANNNTAVGKGALKNITTGAGNIGIGVEAGALKRDNSLANTNTGCIYIGNGIRSSNGDVENEIVIGNGAVSAISNSITLGNSRFMTLYIGDKEIYNGDSFNQSLIPKTPTYQMFGWGGNLNMQVNTDGTPVKGVILSPTEVGNAYEISDPNATALVLPDTKYTLALYSPYNTTINSISCKSRFLFSTAPVTNVVGVYLFVYESDDGINFTKNTSSSTLLSTFSSSSITLIMNANIISSLNIPLTQGKYYLLGIQPIRISGSDATSSGTFQGSLQVFYQYQ